MAEFLIRAIDAPVNEAPCKWRAARIVHVEDDGHVWGAQEKTPKFYLIKVPSVSKEDSVIYLETWAHKATFEVVSSSLATDTHDVKITTERVSITGKNAFTVGQVESFFDRWGASITTVADNQIDFSLSVFDAITSSGFWGVDVSGVTFTETDYDQSSGVHTVQFQNSPFQTQAAHDYIVDSGGTIISDDTFAIARSVVRAALIADIKERIDDIYYDIRRFRISAAGMNALAANGGVLTVTAGQFVNNLEDGLQT